MITLEQAMNKLCETLVKDSGYWYSWRVDIARSFIGELTKAGYRFPEMAKLAHEASQNFLEDLCKKELDAQFKGETVNG